MSRIAKIPVSIAKGVTYTLTAENITVKGPVGEVSMHILPKVAIKEAEGALHFEQLEESREANANVGTMRALVADMVKGCSVGFEKKLQLVGVGYRAQAQGDKLNLTLGFSHPVVHQMPAGVKVETPSQTEIVIKGADKQKVGQTAAEVRAYRAPEPYKGKGVRYVDEVVVIKETKKK
ncbi:MAG: 50S ribosomal protein L6 [Sutterella parvirubra]|uniref:Large ribosomal subunit protein uL6 n=1 Tax=Sutterella parvirubra YIT 11816 TaxID=762967 RepID=H3KBK2_9BURK|nr:50S ribosomal protein L6 [Sutterella parvirubra]EHY32488.1 ribosomal protein L6 [Sutterella parvirubra YIT 11816]MDR3770399.1 50S ribosomal protein L6 [Sutterella sp.]MDY5201612.1 50S ribosomal protein L6 [Sutterella parvirubra]